MYQYTSFDRQVVHQRAAQFRDQLERNLKGELADDDFRPLRLQNGWYIQRHAPMLRVAVPYGELSSAQLRQLAVIARELDRGFGHFTTRQNLQFNWIPLERSADAMDLLAEVDMHGIQTSGNCIRNITSDALAGIAPDEIVDPRPYCEILRQWSTLQPEFAFLPRKFKIAVSGAAEDRAAIAWHDVGLQLLKNKAGEVGFKVYVGGGMGRTPVIGSVINAFVPWQEILVYLEAIVRVYNRFGRRDNLYKARIKILVKAEGQKFFDAVNAEFDKILNQDADGREHIIPVGELERVSRSFVDPAGVRPATNGFDPHRGGQTPPAFLRWLERNVHAHRVPGYRAVTLSLKRAGQAPGDVTAEQMDIAATMADRYSLGELRVTHEQNLLLPWVREADLLAVWHAAREAGFATPNIGLLTDIIACPGGDFCALANARSIPVAADISERFADLDAVYELGPIDLHISGCMNSCGHHHTGHIGVLGVDKDGKEWYQVSVGGSDGSQLSGPAVPGKVIGPAFAAEEVADVVEALIEVYQAHKAPGEHFVDTVRRLGIAPLRAATDAVRQATAQPATAETETV
ncbi:nitrite/sulfite reductase [Ideonella sp. B7]|uniref:nitrite/sulfite reductase n=1 Tax=Ideonella benzenivorans TaxID=2831643 RepID=UPI001CECC6E6|nr:nitrite/sulfite reductase [Ideonella benzenivorans]MCA6216330.1 nitrite/sulfite reductase [Ideonella benzenivorans]